MSAASPPLPPEKNHWLGKSIFDRQQWTESFFVEYPNIQQIERDFYRKLEYCERSGKYSAMLIIGGSGAGKTTFAKRLHALATQRYARHDDEKSICPVVQFAVPDPCTPYEFSVAVLTALGDREPRSRKNRAETKKAAEILLRNCEVMLVLIDNLQDVPARRATRGIELVGTRLRDLIDSSGALWVFLGTEEAQKVVHRDAQLIKRISYRAHLKYFQIKTRDEKVVFANLLSKVDKWVPLAEPSCIANREYRGRFYCATEGIFDRLVALIDCGWLETVNAGRETMVLSDLEKAFVQVHGPTPDHKNPFHPSFIPQNLRGEGEPFEVLRGN
jgi:hypothetical protein